MFALSAPAILSNSSIFEQQETVGRIYLTVGQRATMFTKTTLIVSCPTQGMEKPHVQWLKGSAVIPQNRTMRVREISGGAIKFAQLSVDDSGVYTCQAGPLSENFYLTVGKFLFFTNKCDNVSLDKLVNFRVDFGSSINVTGLFRLNRPFISFSDETKNLM